jgi:hypothetical protein
MPRTTTFHSILRREATKNLKVRPVSRVEIGFAKCMFDVCNLEGEIAGGATRGVTCI